MRVYKIRHSNNDKHPYLSAGCSVSKNGKIWSNIGHVINAMKNYLRNVSWRDIKEIPDSWIVEEYELVKVNEYSAKELIEGKEEE